MLSHRPVGVMAAHESSSSPPPTQFQTAGMQISALEHNVHHAQLLAMAAGGSGMEFLGLPSKPPPSSHLMNYLPPPPPEASLRFFFDGAEQQQQRLVGGSGRLSLSLYGTKSAGQPLMEYGMMDFSRHHQPLLQQQQQQLAAAPALQMRIISRFLTPAQELLNEFCSLTDESSSGGRSKKRPGKKTTIHEQLNEGITEQNSSLSVIASMDLSELQKIKSKLLSMINEVDRRYRRYGEQMRAVVDSFEAVAGDGAARVYAALASAAMSKHFRCLRDGIAGQLAAVRKAMGEKGAPVHGAEEVPAGTSLGETPRLKLLDQCMRQHKALHQGTLEQHPWRPQRGLPERAVTVLRAWLFEHFLHPYPNDTDKHILARQTGLSRSQVSNWFINARVRLWKPMVEEIYTEEMKELALHDSSTQRATGNGEEDASDHPNPNPNPNSTLPLPPLPEHELLIDSESLSSVISTAHQHHHRPPAKTYDDVGGYGYGSRSSGVSLTLGLQHHSGGGMSLSLLPNSQQHSDFFAGDGSGGGDVDGDGGEDDNGDEQQVHFSILDGEAASLPYRNLMGAQLLHDLAR